MVVFAVACLVVAVVLGVALVRARARTADLDAQLRNAVAERDRRADEAAAARDAATAAERQRDDAHERVQRSRRDAADVAARLRDEAAARAEADAELVETAAALREARATLAETAAALEDARSDAAGPSAGDGLRFADELWALLLRDVEHTWTISVAAPGAVSPLVEGDSPFRAAVEVEVDAAREESGAGLELLWSGDFVEPPAETAAVALALVRDVIATVGTAAARTDLTIRAGGRAVDVRVVAVDDDGDDIDLALPPSLAVAPGHARVPVLRATSRSLGSAQTAGRTT